jgi:hypothetical protein
MTQTIAREQMLYYLRSFFWPRCQNCGIKVRKPYDRAYATDRNGIQTTGIKTLMLVRGTYCESCNGSVVTKYDGVYSDVR